MELGEAWGRGARAGWVIGLVGELGAGKTQLVKGLARGLGVVDRVHSPTFALVNEYSGGRLCLSHLDLYRIETWPQFQSADLATYCLAPVGVTVVEWFDRCDPWITAGLLPPPGPCFRRVVFEAHEDPHRCIRYEDFGV